MLLEPPLQTKKTKAVHLQVFSWWTYGEHKQYLNKQPPLTSKETYNHHMIRKKTRSSKILQCFFGGSQNLRFCVVKNMFMSCTWTTFIQQMGVSEDSGTPKWMVYSRKPLLKWMIWGYYYFWKHPNCVTTLSPSRPPCTRGMWNCSTGRKVSGSRGR